MLVAILDFFCLQGSMDKITYIPKYHFTKNGAFPRSVTVNHYCLRERSLYLDSRKLLFGVTYASNFVQYVFRFFASSSVIVQVDSSSMSSSPVQICRYFTLLSLSTMLRGPPNTSWQRDWNFSKAWGARWPSNPGHGNAWHSPSCFFRVFLFCCETRDPRCGEYPKYVWHHESSMRTLRTYKQGMVASQCTYHYIY